MTYKDMTFCPFTDCKDIECIRRLTEEVKGDAGDMPTSQFAEKPDCYKEIL